MSDGGQRSFAPCARGGLRLVATDLDGTLLDSHKQVSPRSRAAIARLAERHIPLIVATGRPLRWLPPVWQQLPVSPLCICMNGALIYDAFRHKILRRTLLQSAELTNIVQSIHRALPEACFAVERSGADTQSQGDGHLPGEFLIAENAEEVWYEQNAPRTTLAALSEEPAAKLLVRCTELSSAEMAEIVRPLVDPVAHVTYSIDSGLLEISHPLATKGEALAYLLDCWDVPEEAVVAFGNMPNDMDMLQLSTWGVAVENAHHAVLAAADEVTASNDDDGVALVMERLLAE